MYDIRYPADLGNTKSATGLERKTFLAVTVNLLQPCFINILSHPPSLMKDQEGRQIGMVVGSFSLRRSQCSRKLQHLWRERGKVLFMTENKHHLVSDLRR
ncbi:hypothetical protein CEXT_746751 [Caerostris extrusa]|uniref:Uncharacterized protein n=1 Tax=Caerostris extrusa TaxID=172846 RepID=A0AAV4X016_CAEEX|nr:hypothetical protein CEXT_746751 [Caerostris extrusa]